MARVTPTPNEDSALTLWHPKPLIYEINTWVWLNTLSRRYGRPITLSTVPDDALEDLARSGINTVWLMGVWARSPAAAAHARQWAHEYKPALPDLTDEDVIGSAYAIHDYQVDQRIGGRKGLAALRRRLKARGLRLILDYVPNHVALDHPWVRERPACLIQGTPRDLKRRRSDFFQATDAWGRSLVIAHGRDPYFPGWADTAQVNAFSPEFRQAALETLLDIASQCDGVRCDMAMLLTNRVFGHTWQGYYLEDYVPETEFWEEIIPQVRAQHPEFLFIAEVYWNMEYEMQQQGFDYCYDKTLYDRLTGGAPRDVRVHLIAAIEYQRRLVRFIENHDEPRAYSVFGGQRQRPAAVLVVTLPGATLLHDGQFSGRRVKLPVQIGRQPDEPADHGLEIFYRRLLAEVQDPIYGRGRWRLFNLSPAWGANHSHESLVAHGWSEDDDHRLVVVNLTGQQAQALINLSPWHGIAQATWSLDDALSGHRYIRTGASMVDPGLYIDLGPYEAHMFRFRRL